MNTLQTMTPEAQRIAIAEACGWKWIKDAFNEWRLHSPDKTPGFREDWIKANSNPTPDQKENSRSWDRPGCPDYLNDLNAIHEAEKILEGRKCSYGWAATNRFSHELSEICKPFNNEPPYIKSYPWHATAAQRAEAFLRTIAPTHPTP